MKIQLLALLKLVVMSLFVFFNKGMTQFYNLVNDKSADVVGIEKMGEMYVCVSVCMYI